VKQRHQNTSKDIENIEVVAWRGDVLIRSRLEHLGALIAEGVNYTAEEDHSVWVSTHNFSIGSNLKACLNVDEVNVENQDGDLDHVDDRAQQVELEAIRTPLEIDDVHESLALEHFKLACVRAHVEERDLLVHDHLLAFDINDMLTHHGQQIDGVTDLENLFARDFLRGILDVVELLLREDIFVVLADGIDGLIVRPLVHLVVGVR
jgi:hypothetical protein